LALFGGLLWLSLRSRLNNELDEQIEADASRFEAYFRRESAIETREDLKTEMEEFCQALPATVHLSLTGSSGFEFYYPQTRSSLRHTHSTQRTFTVSGETFRLELNASSRDVHHTLELLEFLLLSLIPVAVGLACLGGAWLSRRALKPVDEITAAARAISIENLSQRLPVPSTGDELARLTEVWNSMLSRLETAVQTLSQFAADASHELRTPLAVIRTSAELALRRAREPEAYRDSLRDVMAEVERLTLLVEDLLFLARSDAGAAQTPNAPVDLGDTMREAVDDIRDLADSRDIRLQLTGPAAPSIVTGNRPALRRLFLALLDNAIKYSPDGASVDVRVSQNAVIVEDRGIGIAAADLPNVFKRFYRADKARSSGGHGLGLALAQSIAQAHGAVIEAASREGEGSAFTVRFLRAMNTAA
jgi:heavy metal sensor kinase